jgi:hypothetical protein
MTGLDWLSVFVGGLGVLMLVLSPLAKPTRGYQELLDLFGPQSVFGRDLSRHKVDYIITRYNSVLQHDLSGREMDYNRNPRAAVAKGGIAFIIAAIALQVFQILIVPR